MDVVAFNKVALLAFLTLFSLVGVVVPTLRMQKRTGGTGFVAHRAPSPVHQVAIEGMRLITPAIFAWPVLFALLGPERLDVWNVPVAITAAGWAFALGGLILVVAAQTNMGASWRIGIDAEKRTDLVTHGLFGVVRNPIFSGMLLAVSGMTLITPSPWSIMGLLFVGYTISVQVRLEEEHLTALHGEAYRAYAARVGRFIPGVAKLSPR